MNKLGVIILFCMPTWSDANACTHNDSLSAGNYSELWAHYRVNIQFNPFRFELADTRVNKKLLCSKGPVSLRRLSKTNVFYKKPYTFFNPGKTIYSESLTRITGSEKKNGLQYFYLGNSKADKLAVLTVTFNVDSSVSIALSELRPRYDGVAEISEISIDFESDTTDTYLGMGMRFNSVNHYGTKVTNWAEEVGPNLPDVTENGTTQGRDCSYAPVPFFINLKGYGLFMKNLSYSEFDFAKTEKNTLRITNKDNDIQLRIYLATSPLEIAGKYMRSNGSYTLPKPWVFGVWAAAGTDYQSREFGENINYTVLNNCRNNNIPLSAIMAEDWYFDFLSSKPIEDWRVNRKYYPNYERMIEDQHKSGVKHIGYFLPYIGKMKLFKLNKSFIEGDTKGIFTKNATGQSYEFNFFVWKSAQFDWTNPHAGLYFRDSFYSYATRMGVDGWMNDFGEYTPYKSKSFNGEWGTTMHNRYPLLWAKNAKDFMSKIKPSGDYCIFSRSGAAGLHQYNDFIFTGDRNADYDQLAGLGGQITGMLSGSMSVHPNVSVDIGAYNCIKVKPMGKLMMFRWIELGALVPVMRLHRGVQLCDHWRFDEDSATLMHWKKYAVLHAKLFPYIYSVAKQSADFGWPMVRHLGLYHPTDNNAIKQNYEFLLGDRILSCPVINEDLRVGRFEMSKARQFWEVYLPRGNWYHYWSNQKYSGSAFYKVPAPPGSLPMFIQEGKIIPTFDREVDSFVEGVENPAIKDFEYVNASLQIYFYGYGEDTFTLWDGTVLKCSRAKGESGTFEVLNEQGRKYTCAFID